MAPPTPARIPATPRTTRSKANTSGSSSQGASTPMPSIAVQPSTPAAGVRETRIPMTTGKMGLLGRKPSRLFGLKGGEAREDGPAKEPVVRRLASFTQTIAGKSRVPSGAAPQAEAEVPQTPSASTSAASPSIPPTTHETVQAFLRLRPSPSSTGAGANAGHAAPYIEIQGDRQVVMRSPLDPTRAHAPRSTATYSFDRVFAPDAPQADVFARTTLPMVEQVLHGRGGLLFSYGVSNSGKTYTMQGDVQAKEDKRGMIPRAIQVVFDSVEGLECAVPVKPIKVAGVELGNEAGDADSLSGALPRVSMPAGHNGERIKVDRNYSYAIFVSYVEIYNDKIFDLLDSVPASRSGGKSTAATPSQIPRPKPSNSFFSSDSRGSLFGRSAFSSFASRPSIAGLSSANGGSGIITRQALAIRSDGDGGRYIGGMREVRVRTAEEALGVFMMGQEDRQVFGTLANRQSSRSHGIFTIKVVRVHNGAPNDPDSATVSRLCMVDLAGSERNDKSQAEGERLREACNINKSLFALGTCLKTLRENQALLASRSAGNKRKPAIVSFKHVRLTEVLESFFTGEGRVVMIVNVNPHDTGFHENSQVMDFSALATQVQTTALDRFRQPFIRGLEAVRNKVHHHGSAPATPQNKIKLLVPVIKPTMPAREAVQTPESLEEVEEELQVVEAEPEEEEERETDFLVDFLMQKLEERTYEAERYKVLIGTIEADLREEIVGEMQQQLADLDARWQRRLQEEIHANEEKADRKIDIMQRALDASRAAQATVDTEQEEEEESFASAFDTSLALQEPVATEAPASPTPLRQPLGERMITNATVGEQDIKRGLNVVQHSDSQRRYTSDPLDLLSSPTRHCEISAILLDESKDSAPSAAAVDPGSAVVEAENGEDDAPETSLQADLAASSDDDNNGPDSNDSDDNEDSEDSEDSESEESEEDTEERDEDSSFAISEASVPSSAPSTPVKRTRRSTAARKSVAAPASTRKGREAARSAVSPVRQLSESPKKRATRKPAVSVIASPLAESKNQGNSQTPGRGTKNDAKAIADLSARSENTDSSFVEIKPAQPQKKRKLGKKAIAVDEDALKESGSRQAVRRMVAGAARA